MKKLFQRRKAPNDSELNKSVEEMIEENENAMDKVFQKANELSEAIQETPYALTLTVTRTKFWITEEIKVGDTYSLQEDRKDRNKKRGDR